MVCLARFERATCALEAVKKRLNNSRNNGFKMFKFGVQYTSGVEARIGNPWIWGAICKWASGLVWKFFG
jgi:hypothetical protein